MRYLDIVMLILNPDYLNLDLVIAVASAMMLRSHGLV